MSFRDALSLVRPRQWTKNLAVFAALVFSGELLEPRPLLLTVGAFIAFCLVSGALYAMNDVVDAQRDRAHPVKRTRPVASGRITPVQASLLGVMFAAAGLSVAAFIGAQFLLIIGAYALLHVLYTAWFKHAVIVDMLAIAAGFVLRAVGGAVAIEVPVSPWLVLCTGLLALFLAAAKRRHELVLLREASGGHRPVLMEYSAELLDSFMVTLSAATITSYALYTFFEQRGPRHMMMLTIPFVVYGVLRYQLLVLSREGGGRPEDILLDDRAILIDVVLWIASAVFVLYVAPHFPG